MEQLQSHMWLTASSYLWKYFRISSYIGKPFLISDFATAPLLNFFIYEENCDFLFYQCRSHPHSARSHHSLLDHTNTRLDLSWISSTTIHALTCTFASWEKSAACISWPLQCAPHAPLPRAVTADTSTAIQFYASFWHLKAYHGS